MGEPLVSVIIPTYKRKAYLINRAITSILNQTYQNIELIVVDDSPNDFEYRQEVKDYIISISDRRVKYIKHSKNLGANKARNTGISLANGEFCAFLDDDDEWLKDKIELQLKEFTSPTIGLVYCRAVVINENNNTLRPMMNSIKKGYHYNELLRQNFIGSNSYVIIRTDVLREVGGYDENLKSNQDYDLFLRISKKYEISGVNKVLVNYYDHDGERITKNPEKQLQGRLALYKKHNKDISKYNLKLIWEIKNIPLYYKVGKKYKAFSKAIKLLIKHPIFFINYTIGTLSYMWQRNETVQI